MAHTLGRRPLGQAAQEPYGLRPASSARRSNPAAITWTSAKPRSHRLGQRHLLLHHRAVQRGHRQLVGSDAEVQRVAPADPGQRLAQRVVHVHVGGAAVEHLTVEAAASTSSRA